MARRRDDFPPDRGLEARMLVAVLVQTAILAAYVAGCVWVSIEVSPWVLAFIGGFLLAGIGSQLVHSAREGGEPAERARVEPLVVPLAFVGTITGRIISRHREIAADRAAAVLTGSPARVQAALLAVSGGLERIPTRDLRAVAPRDPFHFVPARPAKGIARLWATHPPLDARIEQLASMEARLQGKSAFTQG